MRPRSRDATKFTGWSLVISAHWPNFKSFCWIELYGLKTALYRRQTLVKWRRRGCCCTLNMDLLLQVIQEDFSKFDLMIMYVQWNLLRRTSHNTDTSLRRTLPHVPAERRCLSHRKTSIRRTIVRRTPLQDGHFYMFQQRISIKNYLLRRTHPK